MCDCIKYLLICFNLSDTVYKQGQVLDREIFSQLLFVWGALILFFQTLKHTVIHSPVPDPGSRLLQV